MSHIQVIKLWVNHQEKRCPLSTSHPLVFDNKVVLNGSPTWKNRIGFCALKIRVQIVHMEWTHMHRKVISSPPSSKTNVNHFSALMSPPFDLCAQIIQILNAQKPGSIRWHRHQIICKYFPCTIKWRLEVEDMFDNISNIWEVFTLHTAVGCFPT